MNARLSVLLARDADVGVVFRRGPSKQVLLLRWNLKNDSFEVGQWLRGRIYERRCDLSPNGERLVYFAASYRGPYQTWTAVSRPPYFAALGLWPKGDAWGRGGLFRDDDHLLLNHSPSQMVLGKGFVLPDQFKIGTLPNGGLGEDAPIFNERLRRDGWQLVQQGTWLEQKKGASVWLKCDPPEIWCKRHPLPSMKILLLRQTDAIKQTQGPWYVTSYRLAKTDKQGAESLGRADWADWASNGDLVFAKDGRIFRMPMTTGMNFEVASSARQLVDLTPLTFVRRKAPSEAQHWVGKAPPGAPLCTGLS